MIQCSKAILILILAPLFLACSQPTEPKQSNSVEPKTVKLDTVVHSIPVGYLDAISGANQLSLHSYHELLSFWESEGYTYEVWKSGVRKIPRAFILNIPHAWRTEISSTITVKEKKLIFFRGMAPLVLRANELILLDRTRLTSIRNAVVNHNSITKEDQLWTTSLSRVYKFEFDWNGDILSQTEALLNHVNIIPESLALAQAAIESGWGTSRFAEEGNSIFGQWAWGKDAIKPEAQRSGMGNYGIASFSSLQESVCAYMLNINTHNAYKALRNKRAELEKENQKLSGLVLCKELNKYSERGWDYVVDLQNMINHNHLIATEDAFFSDASPIYLLTVHNE